MVQIRILKACEDNLKPGDIVEYTKGSANDLVKLEFAEYVTEKKPQKAKKPKTKNSNTPSQKKKTAITTKTTAINNNNDNLLTTTTATTTTTTTTNNNNYNNVFFIHPAGHVGYNWVIEPIGGNKYIYNFDGKRGIAKVNAVLDPETRKPYPILNIEGHIFRFNGRPLSKLPFDVSPELAINRWMLGTYKSKSIQAIFKNMVDYFKLLFELKNEEGYFILALGCLQSWLINVLEAVFFVGLDARKGSGKTSILEFKGILNYHGFGLGDVSPAVVGRAIEKYKCNPYLDEIDQLQPEKKAEIEGILRKSQRKGTPYTRVNKNTMELEFFNTFGYYCFSFRETIEDAAKQRSFIVSLKTSNDNKLPILNYHKEKIGLPLHNDLFFWYLDNIASLKSVVAVEAVVPVVAFLDTTTTENIAENREKLYNSFVKGFSEPELKIMKELTGRNVELAYVALSICKLLNINIFEHLKNILTTKQEQEKIDDSYYIELLSQFFRQLYKDNKKDYTLKNGEFIDCFYFPKNEAYTKFVKSLKEQNIMTIGTHKYSGFLKEIGFVQNYNIKNQRNAADIPVMCLIFDQEVSKQLSFETIQPENLNEEKKDGIKTGNYTELEKDYQGKCSFCGRDNSWIRFKDKDGNHVCSSCGTEEKVQ